MLYFCDLHTVAESDPDAIRAMVPAPLKPGNVVLYGNSSSK